jgi:WD40 repeat protein
MPNGHALASRTDFSRHRGPVTSVAAIPGRAAAVTTAYDGAVAMFDLAAKTVDLLGYHRHLGNHVAVDSRGAFAASSSSDYDVFIWDLKLRSVRRVLRGHSDDVECFAFADDATGVSASRDRRIIVWDLATGAIRKVIEGHDKDVLSVTCHDGLIYSSGDDMTLRQWDLETGRQIRVWGPFETETDSCAIDVLNGRVILGCDDGFMRVFSSQTGEDIVKIAAHASGIKKVAVSRANGDILSCAYDQRIRVWNAESFEPKLELEAHPALWERSFAWAPDGRTVLAGTFDGAVLQWDAASGRLLSKCGGSPGDDGNACFNEASVAPDGTVALVADDGLVRLINISHREARLIAAAEPAGGRCLMNAVTLDPWSDRIIAGAHDHRLHVFSRAEQKLTPLETVALGQGPINSIRVSNHKDHEGAIFAACYSGAIVRVAPAEYDVQAYPLHDGAVKALRLHPREAFGVSCSADGGLMTWTLDGRPIHDFPGHTAIVDDVDFSPDGTRIASTSRDFTVNVYDVKDARLTHSFEIGRRSPKSLCFWNSETVIVGDYWGALLKCDLRAGTVGRRTIAENGISSLSRCGDYLVASSYDGGVYMVGIEDLTVYNVYRAMNQRIKLNVVSGQRELEKFLLTKN